MNGQIKLGLLNARAIHLSLYTREFPSLDLAVTTLLASPPRVSGPLGNIGSDSGSGIGVFLEQNY